MASIRIFDRVPVDSPPEVEQVDGDFRVGQEERVDVSLSQVFGD